ncbi:MAG: response regulator [Desulfobacteraceae bacterium]|jgi:CheY-like chemotaxis protein|nr:response regulator [Desulfobacteraceae bacterium]MDH3572440.1 response regulator [Desulfobacteraceae bacterium]MDH3720641.1 response regulator [Desulfobacteraceae bacterium]MDH3835661.1 response regulator [Desulfobacteraceae bacterium]MDH3873101.1 response regulator [Desulfobacteraceae bacterium]
MSEKIKVLMVDDEVQFRATTKKILNKRGFDTILADSGEEAIEKLAEKPDVVILDIKMPGMDGHQALKEIKKHSPDLPVIMLTGHGALPSAQEALAEGAFDYLSKPCDINLLAGKITDAFRQATAGVAPIKEKTVSEVMIPLEYYTTLTEGNTIQDAVEKLKASFSAEVSTSRLMETGHRSFLVFDENGEVKGMVAIVDLLSAIMPGYLSAPKPSMADSIQYSPMFWSGMFTLEVKQLAAKNVKDIMSSVPLTIDADANLMEAAHMMVYQQEPRLVVVRNKAVVGIIREQDLFFEIEKILRT